MARSTPPPVLAADPAGIVAAVAALRAGDLIGLPTETVYGLAGDALDPTTVVRIFAAKQRPADNPLIVHVAAAEQLDALVARVTPLARSLARAHWPGPLTLVLGAASRVPSVTRGGLDTVAVRVPDHPVATTLLEAVDRPLAAPSANPSGRPSPTRAHHVVAGLGAAVRLVLDGGACPLGVESTVVDARGTRPVVLRDGFVTREQLGVQGAGAPAERHRSPGTRYAHYAPHCAVEVAPGTVELLARVEAATQAGERVGIVGTAAVIADALTAQRRSRPGHTSGGSVFHLAVDGEVDLARELYGAFLAAEEARVDRLLVLAVSEQGVGRAVMDRLRRAAAAGGR